MTERVASSNDGDSVLIHTTARQTRRICAHCKKSGHLVTKCWQNNPHIRPSDSREGFITAAGTAIIQVTTESPGSDGDEHERFWGRNENKLPPKCCFRSF